MERDIPKVDLRIGKAAFHGFFVQPVHLCLAVVLGQPGKEPGALFFGQELCGLGPVDDDELGGNSGDDGEQALEDEQPAPALVAAHAVHAGDAVREEL